VLNRRAFATADFVVVMQPKRALTSVDIAALVTELRRYTGATVDKIYLYPEDLLRIKLRDYDAGRLDLLAAIRDPKRVHLAARERVPDAPERPPNFAMMLRNRITGGTFLGVEQFEFDRIMTLRFERGETTTSIVLELFGDGNIAVLDETGQVVSSLDTVRLKSRTVAPGSTYGYPASRFDPLSATREQFGAAMEESDTDLVRTIATQLNFGGLWGEELCRRAGVEPAMDINEATATTYDELWRAIEQLRGRLKEGDLEPRLYYEESERPVDATPLALEEYAELESEQVASFNDALDRFFEEVATEGADTAPAGPQKPEFEALISRKERILDQQESAIERFEREADAEREKAELVYAEYETVEDVLSTIREAREQELPWTEITARIETAAEEGLEAAQAIEEIDGTTGRVTVALGDEPTEVELLVAEGGRTKRGPAVQRGQGARQQESRGTVGARGDGDRARGARHQTARVVARGGERGRATRGGAGRSGRLDNPLERTDPPGRPVVRAVPVGPHRLGVSRDRRPERRPERRARQEVHGDRRSLLSHAGPRSAGDGVESDRAQRTQHRRRDPTERSRGRSAVCGLLLLGVERRPVYRRRLRGRPRPGVEDTGVRRVPSEGWVRRQRRP